MIRLNLFDSKKRNLDIIYYILSFVCDNFKFFFRSFLFPYRSKIKTNHVF